MFSLARARSFFTSLIFEVSDTQSEYSSANRVAAVLDNSVGLVLEGGLLWNYISLTDARGLILV